MKKSLSLLLTAVTSIALVSAQAAPAQGQVNGTGLLSLLGLAQVLVARLVPFAIGIAVLAFFFFVIKFITKGDAPEEQSKSMKGMGYSILALFVMVSIWGLVGFIGSLTGVGQGGVAPAPGVPSYCDPTKAAGQPGAC